MGYCTLHRPSVPVLVSTSTSGPLSKEAATAAVLAKVPPAGALPQAPAVEALPQAPALVAAELVRARPSPSGAVAAWAESLGA